MKDCCIFYSNNLYSSLATKYYSPCTKRVRNSTKERRMINNKEKVESQRRRQNVNSPCCTDKLIKSIVYEDNKIMREKAKTLNINKNPKLSDTCLKFSSGNSIPFSNSDIENKVPNLLANPPLLDLRMIKQKNSSCTEQTTYTMNSINSLKTQKISSQPIIIKRINVCSKKPYSNSIFDSIGNLTKNQQYFSKEEDKIQKELSELDVQLQKHKRRWTVGINSKASSPRKNRFNYSMVCRSQVRCLSNDELQNIIKDRSTNQGSIQRFSKENNIFPSKLQKQIHSKSIIWKKTQQENENISQAVETLKKAWTYEDYSISNRSKAYVSVKHLRQKCDALRRSYSQLTYNKQIIGERGTSISIRKRGSVCKTLKNKKTILVNCTSQTTNLEKILNLTDNSNKNLEEVAAKFRKELLKIKEENMILEEDIERFSEILQMQFHK